MDEKKLHKNYSTKNNNITLFDYENIIKNDDLVFVCLKEEPTNMKIFDLKQIVKMTKENAIKKASGIETKDGLNTKKGCVKHNSPPLYRQDHPFLKLV